MFLFFTSIFDIQYSLFGIRFSPINGTWGITVSLTPCRTFQRQGKAKALPYILLRFKKKIFLDKSNQYIIILSSLRVSLTIRIYGNKLIRLLVSTTGCVVACYSEILVNS